MFLLLTLFTLFGALFALLFLLSPDCCITSERSIPSYITIVCLHVHRSLSREFLVACYLLPVEILSYHLAPLLFFVVLLLGNSYFFRLSSMFKAILTLFALLSCIVSSWLLLSFLSLALSEILFPHFALTTVFLDHDCYDSMTC